MIFEIIQEIQATVAEMILNSNPSNKRLDRAGEILLSEDSPLGDRESAQALVNEWRASHSLPIRSAYHILKNFAQSIDANALVSRRLKRMESILVKLARGKEKHGKLSSMQDIGGCRVVLNSLEDVGKFLEYHRVIDGGQFVRGDDYINNPKPDGYRGVHVVVRYKSNNPKYSAWDGKKIEIQLRTRLQHAWATAVETVDIFSGQSLKTGGGDQKWKRFFALASTVFAIREDAVKVPGMPPTVEEFTKELRALWEELQVQNKMVGWTATLKNLTEIEVSEDPNFKASIFVVVLDFDEKNLYATPFSNENVDLANFLYEEEEEKIRQGKNAHTVLVAVDKLKDLREAFPNFYADTSEFLAEVLAYLEALDDDNV